MICSYCGGSLVPLGVLGNREHFRCRNCGSDSSSEVFVAPVPVPTTGSRVLLLRGRNKGRVVEVSQVLEDQTVVIDLFGVESQFKRSEYELV